MDLLCEIGRFRFVAQRDGEAAARAFAVRTLAVYRRAASVRKARHGRRDRYRASYVESALSFRHILRRGAT